MGGPLRRSHPRQQRAGPLCSPRPPDPHGGPEPPGLQCPEPAEGQAANQRIGRFTGIVRWLASTSSRVEALRPSRSRLPAPERTCSGTRPAPVWRNVSEKLLGECLREMTANIPTESISCSPFCHVEEFYDIYAAWRCHRAELSQSLSLAPSSVNPVCAARVRSRASPNECCMSGI